jgi:hypothetical protein
MEKGFLEREIQGPTSPGSVGLWRGERIYREGNPGTDPMVWWVSDMEKGFIEREIQGPTP